ncbi:MAG: glutamate racemase [Treponema sp.]|jgi:glutamate racemase|nr:glutamate racemase [Treponema sp.]
MDGRPLLFLDSGIGGVPYCRDFSLRNPGEPLVYAADRLHFPYGKRGKDDLISIVISLMKRLVPLVDPKLAVAACNTASVAALDALREAFPGLPLVGTVPAVKPAAAGSRKRKIGVLGTERTVEDAYFAALILKYGGGCEVTALAAPDLVEFVERRYMEAGTDERRDAVLPWVRRFRAAGVDTLVLGCTHFLFLRDEFRREAAPDITVYDSVEGISSRIAALLDEKDLRAPPPGAGGAEGLLVITGREKPERSWPRWAEYLGFRLLLLEEM